MYIYILCACASLIFPHIRVNENSLISSFTEEQVAAATCISNDFARRRRNASHRGVHNAIWFLSIIPVDMRAIAQHAAWQQPHSARVPQRAQHTAHGDNYSEQVKTQMQITGLAAAGGFFALSLASHGHLNTLLTSYSARNFGLGVWKKRL